MAEQCSNCKFYTDDVDQVRTFGGTLPGICRRNPPVVEGSLAASKTMFPPCRPDTWCGQWVTM